MTKANPFRFSTKYQDDETDLLYYGYRYEKDGRWLSRDPIGEKGGMNLYAFVGGDPLNRIDPIGLLKFEGCSPARQTQIEKDFKDFCNKVDTTAKSAFRCCVNHFNIPDRLKSKCNRGNELTIKCEQASTGSCNGACGWSLPGGSVIHLCPDQWTNPGCGDVGCTLLHEMTHQIGHGTEKWPRIVEKCLGCP